MRRRVQITQRGVGLAAVGTLVTVTGVLLGVPMLTRVGLLLLLSLLVGFAILDGWPISYPC